MKLCTFEVKTVLGPIKRLGIETPGGKILDLNLAYTLTLAERDEHPRARELAGVLVPPDMLDFLKSGSFGRKAVDDALEYLDERIDDEGLHGAGGEKLVHTLDTVRLLAPLPRPNTIRDHVGFFDHVRNARQSQEIPKVFEEIPAIYYKGNPEAVAGTDTDVIWPPYTEKLDYELEFAAVIGRKGVNIPPEAARDYIVGYTIFNDVSARDIQRKEMSSGIGPSKGKDFDGSNILGPFLVTADEFDPREPHSMVARVNGEEWSRGLTSAMDNDFADVVSYISQSETLYPGDLIGSGTVPTGCGLELQRFPKPGDVIELEVEGIGILRNRYVRL